MRRGKSLIGKDVLALEDAQKIDTVNDVVIDTDARSLVALVVSEGGFLSSAQVIPLTEVTSFGRDAIMARSSESVVAVGDQPELQALVDREEKLLGKTVYSVEGNKQGTITDIYFDERTGRIAGYEVSGGLVGNITKGTSYLSSDELTNIGPELVYVQPETEQALEQQVGGVQGALAKAGERIGTARDQAGQQFGEAAGSARAKLAHARPEDSLVGRRTGSDVEADDGEVIVPSGSRVRADDIERAKERGKLGALTASVAAGDAQQAKADAADAMGDAGDAAANLWDAFTRKVAEMTDATGRKIDADQAKRRLAEIEDAIGRPVTKVILDRDDNVVLNFGDIITHAAVQRADEAGGLDSLLASVYRGDIELANAQMRAPVAGAATIEKATGGADIVEQLERKVADAEREREADQERKRSESEARRADRARQRDQRRRKAEERRAQSQKSPEHQEVEPISGQSA